MTDTKISNLITASTLDGTEYLGGVQGGNSRKITVNQVKTFTLADGGGAASDGDLNVIQLSDGSGAFKASIVSIADDGTISVAVVGATDNGNFVAIIAGNGGDTSGNGGSIDVNSGSPVADGDGGTWGAHAGDAGSGTGEGGSLSLTSGLGGSTSGSGGDFNITAGGSPTSGHGGGVYISSGGAASGDGGDITLSPGATDGGGRNGELILQNLPTEDTLTTDAIWVDPSGALIQGGHQYQGIVINRVKAIFNPSDLLTMNSDPQQVLAAPGANKINQVTSVSVTLLYGTSSYTGMDAPKLYYGTSTSAAPVSTFLNFKDVIQNSQSCSQGDPDSGYARNNLADLVDQAIYLCDTADGADGDGHVILNICYTTISVDNPA